MNSEASRDVDGKLLQELIGARVVTIKFGGGIDVVLYGGSKTRERKYAELGIAAQFELFTSDKTNIIAPDNKSTYAPMIGLLDANLVDITYHDEIISMRFDNGYHFTLTPHPNFEAWTLSGDDLGFYLASPL